MRSLSAADLVLESHGPLWLINYEMTSLEREIHLIDPEEETDKYLLTAYEILIRRQKLRDAAKELKHTMLN